LTSTIIGKDIQIAKELLDNKEVVAIPTETVYGLAANALDSIAVTKIFEAKNRPFFNPLIIHVANWQTALQYIEFPDHLHTLFERITSTFWPGPLTILFKKSKLVPDIVTAGSDKVAIRIPNHPLTLQLLSLLNYPLAAPSANPFGYVSPTTATHVYDGLAGKIPYILDGGKSTVGVESTIIEFNNEGEIIVHRWGGVTGEALKKFAPIIQEPHQSKAKPITAGQLISHYAPHASLYIDGIEQYFKNHKVQDYKKAATISFSREYDIHPDIHQYILSPEASLSVAASKIFEVLRDVDSKKFDIVIAELFPNEGLGKAINDRLSRAQKQHKLS
jgi:L-threonylcarbamoyladenylate synthase